MLKKRIRKRKRILLWLPAESINLNILIKKWPCLRIELYALQHKFSNSINLLSVYPPITKAISYVNTKGALSVFYLLFKKKKKNVNK